MEMVGEMTAKNSPHDDVTGYFDTLLLNDILLNNV